MNVCQFFVVVAISLFSFVASAAEVTSVQAGRFTVEFTDSGPVVYGDKFGVLQRPLDEFGPWDNQVFINFTTGQLVFYKCSYAERGELVSCSPKLVDTVITPDPASLPEELVIGFVRNIKLASPSFEMLWHITENQESVWADTRLYGVVGPLSTFWTNHSTSHIYMRPDAMEQLLLLLGQQTMADTAIGGVMVFLERGDGKFTEQSGIAIGNDE